jgi:hypothetical protein
LMHLRSLRFRDPMRKYLQRNLIPALSRLERENFSPMC